MERLKAHILRFANPSEQELEEFLSLFQLLEVQNKDFLLQGGECCHHKFFILQGCFRAFFINDKGVEKIINFGIEDWWINDPVSFGNQVESDLFIQAIEKSQVLKISKSGMEKALTHSLEINKYFRVLNERILISNQKRIQYMFNLSGRELYDVFRESNPGFVQRVPQYMLASYLGFTPEFLSKIRSEK